MWIGSFVGVELYLATDYPVAALYGWALGTVVAQATFRWFVPEDVFPVRYGSGGKAAHLDLGGERRVAVVHAMHDQLGLTVTEVEPFGLEGSGGEGNGAPSPSRADDCQSHRSSSADVAARVASRLQVAAELRAGPALAGWG